MIQLHELMRFCLLLIHAASETLSFAFILPLLFPHLYVSEAIDNPMMRLGWPLYRFMRLAHRSHLDDREIDDVKELGLRCLAAVQTAVPVELRSKPKWHYSFVHLHAMLSRYGSVRVLLIRC